MKYISTRGVNAVPVSFQDVLFSGYATDGGLFVPESIPKLTESTLKNWKNLKLTYTQIVHNVVRLFVPDNEISDRQLSEAISKAYSKFSSPEIIPLTKLDKGPGRGSITVAELYHGKTASFKDLALCLLGQFMQHFMETRKGHVTVLVGTSGDTGSAAMESVRGLSNVSIVVLYPKGMVTEVQEHQMRAAAMDDNVSLFEVEGTSDDLDVPIGQCFPDPSLTCINSINWARIMIQICHYVYLYINDGGEGPIRIVIPTGAAGNVTAGVYAKLMGVPLELYVACNQNSCVHDLVSHGVLEMGRNCVQTPANAMDICNPYNVERLIYLASNSDAEIVKTLMTGNGNQNLPATVKATLTTLIQGSESYDNKTIYETMKHVTDTFQYIVCPHTATAFKFALDKLHGDSYVLATASPFKFSEAVVEAGISSNSFDRNQLLTTLCLLPLKSPKQMKSGDNWLDILKEEIRQINGKWL